MILRNKSLASPVAFSISELSIAFTFFAFPFASSSLESQFSNAKLKPAFSSALISNVIALFKADFKSLRFELMPSLIPNPYSALSSNNELPQAGPSPSLFLQ